MIDVAWHIVAAGHAVGGGIKAKAEAHDAADRSGSAGH
jgi:hypothetical protein